MSMPDHAIRKKMIEPSREGTTVRRAAIWQFGLGCSLAVALLAGVGECYVRLFPARDFDAYGGGQSTATGIYAPDAQFGVSYRSWEAFCADNKQELSRYLPWPAPQAGKKIWAFFGNSFVQAPGMLADQARGVVSERRIFKLGRNEPLPIRLAQIRLLLDHGMNPERIFFNLMPVDLIQLGTQPLATIRVTSTGGLSFQPRLPRGALGWLTGHCQLARTAWFRAGQHEGNPGFRLADLNDRVDEPLLGDLHRLFAGLSRIAQSKNIPVTILLIPNYEQVLGKAGFAFQDTVTPMLSRQGFDVFDPRDAFRRHGDHRALFLPDKHFTELGNRILLTQLLDHLHFSESPAQARTIARIP
jgi:hypothetical protein